MEQPKYECGEECASESDVDQRFGKNGKFRSAFNLFAQQVLSLLQTVSHSAFSFQYFNHHLVDDAFLYDGLYGRIAVFDGAYDASHFFEVDTRKENEDGRYNSNENIIDQPEAESFWAESLINKYLDQISHENYRAVIRAVVLEGMSREDFAEESGISYTAVNLLLNHAMTSLTTVALQDIRWRSKKSYTNYIHLIKDDKDRMLLKDYFENNIYNNGLALAVRRLIKISIREMKEQEAEERRASRSHQN